MLPSTCYCAILRAAARKTTALYDDELEPAGVTIAQYSLMRRVEREGCPSLTELARAAELDRSTVGRNVKLLERIGLVHLAPGRDRREATVALTPLGQDALMRAAPLWGKAQRRIEAMLGVESARSLRALAQTV